MAERSGSPHRSLYKLVGSPPWKEAFRQGCLERMRNNRDRLLNKYRQAGGSMLGRVQSTLLVQELMKEEWNALQSMERCPEALAQWEMPMDVAELEEIQQELIDQEQSIISEYEKSLQFDEKCLSIILAEWEANSLICPVCTKYNLRITSGVVMCQCGLYIPSHSPELTEQKLRARLEVSVNEHSAHCPHTPVFSVTEGTEKKSNLLMSCLLPQWDELSRLQSAVELSWSVGLLETGKAPDQVLEEMGLQHLGCDDLKPAFTHFVLLGWKQFFPSETRSLVNTNLSFITYFTLKLSKHVGSWCFVMQVEREGTEIENPNHLRDKPILLSIIMLYKNLEIIICTEETNE